MAWPHPAVPALPSLGDAGMLSTVLNRRCSSLQGPGLVTQFEVQSPEGESF